MRTYSVDTYAVRLTVNNADGTETDYGPFESCIKSDVTLIIRDKMTEYPTATSFVVTIAREP